MLGEKRKLIVVYEKKDEMIFNYLKKLIETEDDNPEYDVVVGTKDGTVTVIGWTEKVYKDNKTKGSITNKILFLDDVKGVKNIIPIMDLAYDECGVSYGFAGNQAVISIDEKKIDSDEKFAKLINLYKDELYRIGKSVEEPDEVETAEDEKTKKRRNIFKVATSILLPPVGVMHLADTISNEVKDKKNLRRTMYILGITKFYLDELENFLD